MRSKGFTLIELLAVIVILAIIALIAVPIVLNIIKDSKESATIRGVELYIDAVNLAIARASVDPSFPQGDIECNLMGEEPEEGYDENDLLCNGYSVRVDVSGEAPIQLNAKYQDGKNVRTRLITKDKVAYKYQNGKVIESVKFYKPQYYTASCGSKRGNLPTGASNTAPSGSTIYFGVDLDSNNKIESAYICFTKDDEEYCLKGADSEAYTTNIKILKDAFSNELNACNGSSSSFGCSSPNINLNDTDGWISIFSNVNYYIYESGSFCIDA